MRRISLFLAFFLTGAVLLAGCGGSSSSSKSSSAVTGADLAPASALAFVAVNSDISGTQWTQAKELLSRFPQAQQSLDNALGSSGISLTDIEQALGKNTAVVVMGSDSNTEAVLLTDTSDSSKIESLISSGGSTAITDSIDSWTAVANSQSAIDQLKSETEKGKLSDLSDFKEAIADLPADSLVKAYVSGSGLRQVISSASASSSALSGFAGASQAKWAGLAVTTATDGLVLEGEVKTPNSIGSASSTLLDQLPSTTSFVVDLDGKALGLDKAVTKALGDQLSQLAAIGITSEEISALLASEIAVYGTESGLGVAIKTSEADNLLAAIDRLVTMVGAQAGVTVKPVTIGGISAKELTIQTLRVDYGVANGNLFFVTDEASLPGATRIADDPAYAAAAEELSVPSSSAGVVFVDFSKIGSFIQSFQAMSQSLGSTPSTVPDLSSLQNLSALLGYVSGSDDKIEFKALLTIK
jgi:hypothetical protein